MTRELGDDVSVVGLLTPSGGIQLTSNANGNYAENNSWAAGLRFGGAAVGMSGSGSGTYTKIGRLVVANFSLTLTAKGSSTGNATIVGLPFTAAGAYTAFMRWSSMTSTLVNAWVVTSSTTLLVYGLTAASATPAQLTHADFSNTSFIQATVIFEV